jgi:hypothetical protein
MKATSMSQLEFKSTTSVIEQPKTVCALDCAATVICLETKSVHSVNLGLVGVTTVCNIPFSFDSSYANPTYALAIFRVMNCVFHCLSTIYFRLYGKIVIDSLLMNLPKIIVILCNDRR